MKWFSLFIIIFILFCCQSPVESEEKLFRLVSPDHSNIHFTNQLNNKQLNIIQYLYYYNGGGVAAGDFNNDGLADLFFTSNEDDNKLYLNKGNLRFEDITSSAGVGISGWSTGVTLVDINNDGYLDIYVCQVGSFKGSTAHNLLYVNNKDLTFTERAAEYGLDFSGFSTQAVFFDYDNDGDLDMYLLNHSVHTVHSYGAATLRNENSETSGDRLFRNDSERGTKKFYDVTREAGIFSSHIGYGLGISVSDVNQDGWLDIYIANDFHENDYLYINRGDGTFVESLEKKIANTSRYSMGCDIADINGDGLPDIMTLDMLPDNPEILMKSASEDTQEVFDIKSDYGYALQYVRNSLQLNQGGYFTEVAQLAGVHATDWSWSALIADYDNDSNAEIFITTGIYKRPNDLDYIQYTSDMATFRYSSTNEDSVEAEMIKRLPTLKIPNYLFSQTNGYRYENNAVAWGLAEPSYSNGSVYADLDNDGDLDLVINNVNQTAFVYENRSNALTRNNFLQLELRAKGNHFGIGSKVKVYAGDKVFFREMILSRGFQSAVAPVLTIGLGTQSTIDSIEIFWRGQKFQVEKDSKVNTRVRITESDNLNNRSVAPYKIRPKFLTASEIQLPYKHNENKFKDYLTEPLIPYLLSKEGPAVAVGDVNGDGLDDVFLGGAKLQPGMLLLQRKDNTFKSYGQNVFLQDAQYEDVDALFVDINNDGFQDLYVVSGGNEFPEGHSLLEDRLYVNDGKGNFIRSSGLLPKLYSNGSCIRSADFNKDGFADLFIGSRSMPGNYGLSPISYILKNDGKGKFVMHQSITPGMITDAAWSDFNMDGSIDLIMVGDWMGVMIYENSNEAFKELKSVEGLANTESWWRSLKLADINNDGLPDIVAGNVGENLKVNPSVEKPLTLLVSDFDENGKIDPILFYHLGDRNIPFFTKQQLAKQMPFLNKKFVRHSDYSAIRQSKDVFSGNSINVATRKYTCTFSTSFFINTGNGHFSKINLPDEVQFSSVNDILVYDFNGDGIQDLFFVGNTMNNTVNLGNSMGQSMVVLLGMKSGEYQYISTADMSNFKKEYNAVRRIRIGGVDHLLITSNNGPAEIFSINALVNNNFN